MRCFGSFAVEVDGRSLGPREWGGRKPKQLLELLVLGRGRPVAKDELIESLWGDSPPGNAAATVESYVSVLRSRLAASRDVLVTESGAYRPDADGVSVDLDEFDARLREAASSEASLRRERLEQALALASGEVLADEPYASWALEIRGVYGERGLQAVCDLADVCLALSDFRGAREHAEQALLLDPYSSVPTAPRSSPTTDSATRSGRCAPTSAVALR